MEILNSILKILEQILQWLRGLNTMVTENFGGLMLIIITVAVLIALRRIKKNQDDHESVKKLAEAIVRWYNREREREAK
ncbi:MAG: hypothetical protein QXG39_01490 [Candidatus Aenigmatarchaeota archaeon]